MTKFGVEVRSRAEQRIADYFEFKKVTGQTLSRNNQ